MNVFDLTIQATLRPELLERTLSSHVKYLFKDCIERARLIINIDCIGHSDENDRLKRLSEIEKIIYSYPWHDKKISFSNEPNFAHAWFRCMNYLESDFFFNLEEDWEMQIEIDFKKMMDLMIKVPRLAHLRLSSFDSTNSTCKNWNKFLGWNGDFFEVRFDDRNQIGWCGHPSLNRTSFIMECLQHMNKDANPEKQIKGRRFKHPINEIIAFHRFGSFHPRNSKKAIIDIGRRWMVENGYVKKGNKAFFTEWQKVDKK